MALSSEDFVRGIELLTKNLEQLQDEEREVGDFHRAFEFYCMRKYSLGTSATTQHITAGKKDLGIDFFSASESKFHVGQCKIPDKDWLEANPEKVKPFGPSAIDDPRDALSYLCGGSQVVPNDRVRHLYSLVEASRKKEDFSLEFFLIVFGRLNERARDAFGELKENYRGKKANLHLIQIDDLIDEFLVGSRRETGDIRIELHIDECKVLRALDYCYFLANAGDVFSAFKDYGWRLFDLNLRYEIRNSPVNRDIILSLKKQKSRRCFHHHNNGLIIVTQKYSVPQDNSKITLHQPQIVNGLQTVKSIFNAVSEKEVSLDDLKKDCKVQVKVIRTDDPQSITDVVRATNNQNPMTPRNLKANNRDQKTLRTAFLNLTPRWFLQVKQGEWESLNQEGARFFKQIVGYPLTDFRPDPTKRKARVIDNEDAAKAWLAFTGFADLAGDRVTHFFSADDVYELAFQSRPAAERWTVFAEAMDFNAERRQTLESQQGGAEQYLLAYFVLQFGKSFVPSPQEYRDVALNEGVKAGKLTKASGSITSSEADQDSYLAESSIYQTWRLMANMKELLVETAAQILARKYGPLCRETCGAMLRSFEAAEFLQSGDIRETASNARGATDLEESAVFSRVFALLRYGATQFWEEKKKVILSSSRLRTLLLQREMAADFKRIVWECAERKGLDKPWKPEGQTFLASLPRM